MLALLFFLGSIPLANVLITHFGLIPVGPFGLMAPAAVLCVGPAFVCRDLVHERFGAAMSMAAVLLGSLISFLVADPTFAMASMVAFLLSEGLDLAVYTPLRKRGLVTAMLASSMVGLWADSMVFLWLAFGSLDFLAGQVVGKILSMVVATAIILAWRRYRLQPVAA
jgi:uncharacterized PurR-regulated membrane protein YhhQ (DUF165 family)